MLNFPKNCLATNSRLNWLVVTKKKIAPQPSCIPLFTDCTPMHIKHIRIREISRGNLSHYITVLLPKRVIYDCIFRKIKWKVCDTLIILHKAYLKLICNWKIHKAYLKLIIFRSFLHMLGSFVFLFFSVLLFHLLFIFFPSFFSSIFLLLSIRITFRI